MVYSEHRFLPNLGCSRANEHLLGSDACPQFKNESLGNENNMFQIIFHLSSF